jgi:hypothetical protein
MPASSAAVGIGRCIIRSRGLISLMWLPERAVPVGQAGKLVIATFLYSVSFPEQPRGRGRGERGCLQLGEGP